MKLVTRRLSKSDFVTIFGQKYAPKSISFFHIFPHGKTVGYKHINSYALRVLVLKSYSTAWCSLITFLLNVSFTYIPSEIIRESNIQSLAFPIKIPNSRYRIINMNFRMESFKNIAYARSQRSFSVHKTISCPQIHTPHRLHFALHKLKFTSVHEEILQAQSFRQSNIIVDTEVPRCTG